MPKVLVVEGNPPEIALDRRKAMGRTTAQDYAAALREIDPKLDVEIAQPMFSDHNVDAIDFTSFDGMAVTGSGVSWSAADERAAPYWDMYEREGFPARINSSYPLNMQITIPLDPFTAESGASAFLPHSQGELLYPRTEDRDRFYAECSRMLADPGDAIIFNGMVWHCAMPNESDHNRSAILIEYLAKFVTPLEDQKAGVRQEVIDRGTPILHQLMSLTYPYPKLFDDAAGKNTIGRDG